MGSKRHGKQILEEAFALYCADMTGPEIIQHLDNEKPMSSATIYKWAKKFNWEDRKQKIRQTIYSKDKEAFKERHRKLLRGVVNLWVTGFENPDTKKEMVKKTTNRDLLEAIKTERLIEGESTENLAVAVTDTEVIKRKVSEAFERGKKKLVERESKSLGNGSGNDSEPEPVQGDSSDSVQK